MTVSKLSIFVISFVLINTKLLAYKHDSLKINKPARHYFKTTIYSDIYKTGEQNLSGKNFVSNKLKTYAVGQFVLGLNIPVFTKDFYNADSTKISNFHFLLNGGYSSIRPQFKGLNTQHVLSKTSFGARVIFNSGRRSIFFAEFSPFMTQDNGYAETKRYRLATTLLYNCAVNNYFSFRVGYSLSYLYGNRYHLPYIGIRVGKLDGFNFSVQFPRSVTINLPINKYIKTSLYAKPQGGLYSMANTDTIYYLNKDNTINFGRYEFIGGLRVDILPSKFFNFYVSGGYSVNNSIGLFSESYNRRNKGTLNGFYKEKVNNTFFVNFGIAFKFGRVKSIYNNYNLYDAHDLNSIDGGDNNINTGSSLIPTKENKIKNINPKDVQDLIDTQDLY